MWKMNIGSRFLRKMQLLVWFTFLTAEVRAIHAFYLMLIHTVLAPFKAVFQEASHADVEASRDGETTYSVSYLSCSRMYREIQLKFIWFRYCYICSSPKRLDTLI